MYHLLTSNDHSVRCSFLKKFILSFILILSVSIGYCPFTLKADSKQRQVSPQKRAVNAERQLRAYHRRLALEKKKATARESFAAPSSANSLTINPNAPTTSTIFFYDNMENGSGGWTVETHTDSAVWHQTTIDANSPTHSWWAGIELQGNYKTGTRVTEKLISPAISLSGGAGPVTLLFTENYVTERGWDFCMVDITTDGGTTWTHLRGGYGESPSGDSRGWIVSTLNLTPYANQTINLRFVFDTGDSLFNAFPGWFIDNVVIFDQSGTITGTTYFDMNQNGVLESEETGLGNWFVMATGPINIMTRTDDQGIFSAPLPLGSYQISEIVPAPWTQTSSPESWNIDLNLPGQIVSGVDFGNYRSGSVIRGTVFNDVDKDSVRDESDPPLVDQYVVLLDSLEEFVDEAYSDSLGRFHFLLFTSGHYRLRQYLDDGWTSTVPGGNPAEYIIDMPHVDTLLGGFLFGSYFTSPPEDTASIRGYVFNDLDHNGAQDEREPKLANRVVTIYYNNSDLYDETTTDSLGSFMFRNLPAGAYSVRLGPLYRWQQSYPDTLYNFELTGGELKDSVIFGTYELPVGSIRGTVFNDVNRNGVRDSLEPGLEGWVVSAKGPGDWSVDGITDTAGNYVLNDVVEGPHTVLVALPWRWGQSVPLSSYNITLGALETKDSLDFGAYALLPGSISGTVFNDLNGNAARDPDERGIANSQIRLEGDAVGATSTDENGQYQFNGVWSGSYQVRQILNSNWRQTYPVMLQPQHVALGVEDHRTAIDFGLTFDSTFNLAFRTFFPESLALVKDSKGKPGKSEKPKPYASEATFDLITPIGDLTGLHVEFSQAIYPASLTVTHFPPPTPDPLLRKWEFTLDGTDVLANGEHVIIFARGNKGKPLLITKYWWVKGAESPALGTEAVRTTTGIGRLLPHMPNTMNMLEEMYRQSGGLNSLRVGLGGPHSVFHVRPVDVWKSLLDRHGMHIGPPRCLGIFATTLKSITKPMKTLPPTKGNNILFAEALALKVNLSASESWITPIGLGYLIFREDSPNQFNGLSIYKIAAKLDTAMSAFDEETKACLYDDAFFNETYRTLRMIDSAFSGPFDTASFTGGLVVKPVRYLSDVPYLHLDSTFSSIAASPPSRVGNIEQPAVFGLQQNYPNPFNPTTTISFTLPEPALVTLTIYNMLGQEVATPANHELMDDGDQEVEFNANDLPSGVYFYHLRAEGIPDEEEGVAAKTFTAVRRMVLVK